jgi:hypothetical protein
MGPSLWARVAIGLVGLFIIALVPIGEAGAVPVQPLPFHYEFTRGALTGTFMMFNVSAPDGDDLRFWSWTFTAPTGFGTIVWDSANPQQGVFANDNLGTPALVLLDRHIENDPTMTLTLNLGPHSDVWLDKVSGTYFFEHLGSHGGDSLRIEGEGEWARVPEPSTLWSLVLGLLAFVGVQSLSRRNLESSS